MSVLERIAGLRAFAIKYFGLTLSRTEAAETLEVLDLGSYCSRDLPELVRRLRSRH